MATADEYHQYARECLQYASEAQSDHERKQFLNLARAWTQVALQSEGEPEPMRQTANDTSAYPSDSTH